MPEISHLTPLPTTVPPGGVAVVLVDGRVAAENWLQGPGKLTPEHWQSRARQKQKQIEAVVFPRRQLRLRFDVNDLRSAEGVGLDLTVTLALRIEEPVRFLVDVVRDRREMSEQELVALLAGTIRVALTPLFRQRSLAELQATPKLRAWLSTAIDHGLSEEGDLSERSGLAVRGVDAFNLRCQVWDEVQQRRETWYLQATLAAADARGARILDEHLLAELQQHLPLKEELVAHKRRLAGLVEEEEHLDETLQKATHRHRQRLDAWMSALQQPVTSLMRPEFWRRKLGEAVTTAPLCAAGHVYVITKSGRLSAFAQKDGKPVWPQPVALGMRPGDGMIVAAGRLWIPGSDGKLYQVEADNGHPLPPLPLGGSLSSAPLLVDGTLFLSIDRRPDGEELELAGQMVVIDIASRRIQRWPVSRWGLRAQPVLWHDHLFVGDRRGRFFLLDARHGRVEQLWDDSGKILAAAAVDTARQQIIVGDIYGRVRAVTAAGRMRWSQNLQGQVVGRPLLHENRIYVGTGAGLLYTLDAGSGEIIGQPYAARGPIASSPLAWQDWVFFGANDGYLHAYDTASNQLFWTFHSGQPVFLPPAINERGELFVVDRGGNLNALPWYSTRFTEAARRMEQQQRAEDAIMLWLRAGLSDAALELAQKAGRLDWVAQLAADMQWYEKAAQTYETLAGQRRHHPLKAARCRQLAAEQWERLGRSVEARRCRLDDARARQAPLVVLEQGNLPSLTAHQPATLQIIMENIGSALARDVRVSYRGHVSQGGEVTLGTMGPNSAQPLDIHIQPTASGTVELHIRVDYQDAAGRRQLPSHLHLNLAAARAPEIHHHYYGPHVGGDGVIIMRGGSGSGRDRTIQVTG